MSKSTKAKTATGATSKKDKISDFEKQPQVTVEYYNNVITYLNNDPTYRDIFYLGVDINTLAYFLAPDILPDLLDMLTSGEYTKEELGNYIKTIDLSKPRSIIFNSKFQESNKKVMKDEERILLVVDDESFTIANIICQVCRMNSVRKYITQKRAGDEPGTYMYQCLRCGIHWSASTSK